MDSVITFYQILSINSRTVLPNLLYEVFVRILLLLGLILVHLKFQPQARYITEEEMINDYKKPRRDSYVPPWAMILIIIIIPLLILCIPLIMTKNYSETVQALLGWTASLLLNAIFTEFIKLIVLRPRPDFYYRCYPSGLVAIEFRTESSWDIIEGRKSFPSGHSSFAFCSLGFIAMWLKGYLAGHEGSDTFCLLPLLVATMIGSSRCYDNHHHWEDVLMGAILGYIVCYLCHYMYCRPSENRA